MATPLALVWDLIAHDNASAAFTKVGATAGVAAKETSGLSTALFAAGGVIALAGVAVAAVSVKMAKDFQESTTKLVTGAGESEKNIGKVRDGILSMAGAVGTMPQDLSKGMYLIESAGYHGGKGLDVLKAAAEGAKVGGAEMSTVADGLTTAMKDYSIPTSKAAEVTSKLVATVAAGKTNMGDLSASLSGVLPFAASLGVKFNDVAGAMATMTGQGIDAANASTMLRFTMMSMANETPKGEKALKSIGMTAQELKDDLSSKGVGGALAVVTEHIAKKFPAGSVEATKALAAIAGGTRGMGAALALTGPHAKELIANTKSIAGASAEAGGHVKGFALTQEDLATQFDKAKAAVAAAAIKIGDALLPIVTKVMKYINDTGIPAIKDLAKGFSENVMPAIKKVGDFITGTVVPGFVSLVKWLKENESWLAPIAVGVTAMYVAFQIYQGGLALWSAATKIYAGVQAALNVVMAANPIGLVILAIVGLTAGLIYAYKHSETFRDVVNGAFNAVKVVIGNVVSVVIELFRNMLKAWTTVVGGLLSAAATIAEKLHLPFAASMRKASDAFNTMAKAADDKLKSVANSASKWGDQAGKNYAAGLGGAAYSVKAAAANLGLMVTQGFASGIEGGTVLATMAATSMAAKAQAAMAANLRVKSPSKVTEEIGKFFGQGFANGITGTRAEVGTAVDKLVKFPTPGSLDFATSSVRSNAVGNAGRAATSADIQALGVILQGMPKSYQMGQRQGAR